MATNLFPEFLVKHLSEAYVKTRHKAGGVETNIYKLCRVASSAFHQPTGLAIDDLSPQRFDLTAEQGFLDHRALYWNVPRQSGETDSFLRLRIGGVKLRKWGATNIDQMMNLIAILLQTDAANVNFRENMAEDGAYEPALIRFSINPTVFTDNGFDIAAAVTALQGILEEVAPAGVRVFITTAGNAIWDDPNVLWDGGRSWSETEEDTETVPDPPPAIPVTGGIGEDPIGTEPIGA